LVGQELEAGSGMNTAGVVPLLLILFALSFPVTLVQATRRTIAEVAPEALSDVPGGVVPRRLVTPPLRRDRSYRREYRASGDRTPGADGA
jgi:hypothetical protein